MADFENVVVDITAEELEERVKKPIDETAREGSSNLISSGAVFAAVSNMVAETKNIKDGAIIASKLGQYSVGTDALIPSAVTSEKIAESAITEEKVAEKAITSEKIADDTITPENLDRLYMEIISTPTIESFLQLDEYLTPSDGLDVHNTFYKMAFGTAFPDYGKLGNFDYVAFIGQRLPEDLPELILINTENFLAWKYLKNSSEIVEFSSAYIPKDLSKIVISSALGGDWSNALFYVWDRTSGKSQRANFNTIMHLVSRAPFSDTGNNLNSDTVGGALSELGEKVSGFDAALDELHTYAQGLISGGASE